MEEFITKAIQDSMKSVEIDKSMGALETTQATQTEPIVVDKTPIAEPIVSEPVVEPNKENIQEPIKQVEKPLDTPIKTEKTFEELLIEKTKGKVKSIEELESYLEPKSPFFDEEIKRLNDLKASGQEFTPEFWAMQYKDYESLTNPKDILLEAMKLDPEYKGWSEDVLLDLLNDKYKVDEWSEEGEEPNRVERLQSMLLKKDAEKAKAELLKKKEAVTSIKNIDTKALEAQKEQQRLQAEKMQKQFDEYVDTNLVAKTTKISTIIDEKTNETFDYEPTESDKTEAAKIMKGLASDYGVFFNQFKDAEGNIDHKQIFEMLLWVKSKDKIGRMIFSNAKAKGAEEEVKSLNNVNFKKDGTTPAKKSTGWNDAIVKSFIQNI